MSGLMSGFGGSTTGGAIGVGVIGAGWMSGLMSGFGGSDGPRSTFGFGVRGFLVFLGAGSAIVCAFNCAMASARSLAWSASNSS